MLTPIQDNHFYLKGMEYYKKGNQYYATDGTITEKISERKWRDACFSFYLNLSLKNKEIPT